MASNYLRTQLNTHMFGTASYTKPTVLAIALCTTLPTPYQTGATIPELPNTGGYARQVLNPLDSHWEVDGGVVTNSVAITFPVATADWEEVEYVAILDSATWGAGNLLYFGGLDHPKSIYQTDQLVIGIGGIIIKTI